MEVKQNFLQELKDAGILEFQWVSTANNESDIFIKQLEEEEYNKHVAKLCQLDKHY